MRDNISSSHVSRLGLGCSRVGSFNNPVPMSEVRATLGRALELGITVFDTANVYGQGDSEREIGRALRGRRDKAFVITKFGKRFSRAMEITAPLKPLIKPLMRMRGRDAVAARRGRSILGDFDPTLFAGHLEASLRRMRFDDVDAILLHSPSAEVLRDERVVDATSALVQQGKARAFGASCDDIQSAEAASHMPGLGVLQLPLSVISDAEASGLSDLWAQRAIRIFAREVLRDQPDLSPAQAVAAAAARPSVSCVIVGASRRTHLEDLARKAL